MAAAVISEAESVVMAILWQRHPATAEEIIAALAGQQDWQDATVKTLLNRLLNKGAIRADKDGRRYRYAPVLQREEWLAQQSEGLLDRWFGGRVAPLVAHFSKQRKLSARDIEDLKALIEGMRDER
jgi:predicted transcriptional regulator